MLPDLRTREGFDSLKESGYFDAFDNLRQYKMQAEILDLAVKTAGSLTNKTAVISDVAYLVLDSLFSSPRGFEFFPRFPKEEVAQFCQLVVESRVNNLPLSMVCPVCPDYRGHYQLSDGVDDTAERVLNNLVILSELFGKRNLPFFVEMHVADVEAFELMILQASGETTESFLRKTVGSIAATQVKINELGLQGKVRCGSMLEAFDQAGLDYFALKKANAKEIIEYGGKKVRRAVEAVVAERVKLSDFDLIDSERQIGMAAEELADHAVYGDFVNGRAVILTSDAMSPIPAYNFLRGGEKRFNPTIYLKNVKEKKGGGLYD